MTFGIGAHCIAQASIAKSAAWHGRICAVDDAAWYQVLVRIVYNLVLQVVVAGVWGGVGHNV
jgi:hypothetical protein